MKSAYETSVGPHDDGTVSVKSGVFIVCAVPAATMNISDGPSEYLDYSNPDG